MKKHVLVCIYLFSFTFAFAQNVETTFALKAELGYNYRSKSFVSFSASIGFKQTINMLDENVFSALQLGGKIYYNGLGDNILDEYKKTRVDLISSFIACVGSKTDSLYNSNIFIKPFTPFIANAIKDEYHSSFALGGNAIFNLEGRNQIIGFTNINLARVVQISYYNDGPPFSSLGIGDRFDRWWTGGGHIDLYFDQGYRKDFEGFWNSKISYYFDRFTGNVQNAYEVSKSFGFKYVPAKDLIENYYNRAREKFSMEFFGNGYEFSWQRIGFLNRDIQDYVHKKLDIPYHITYAKQYHILGAQKTIFGDLNLKL